MDFTINFSSINLLIVFAATVSANLLGGVWYSPAMFGKPWRAALGIESSGEMSNPVGTFISGFVLQLIAASMLAALLGPSATGIEGMQLGTLIAFSFVATAIGMTNLFEHRPISLILINSGYHFVSFGMMGFIIGQWS